MGARQQFELFAAPTARTPENFWQRVNALARRPVSIVLTRNRVTMISVGVADDGRARVRMHEAFLGAPDAVVEALAAYVRTGKRKHWTAVGAYARAIEASTAGPAHPVSRPAPGGDVHDLGCLARLVNQRYFNGRVKCAIAWGRERPSRRQDAPRGRSMRFGSWSSATRTLRVNPRLDDPRVPRQFIEYILFHEMLHAIVPARVIDGRRYVHSPEFRKLERSFPDQTAMRRLARALLDTLA